MDSTARSISSRKARWNVMKHGAECACNHTAAGIAHRGWLVWPPFPCVARPPALLTQWRSWDGTG